MGCTRPGAILRLRWPPNLQGGHIDLEKGLIHRAPYGAKRTKKKQPPCVIHQDLIPHIRRWKEADEARGISWVVHYRGKPVLKVRRAWATVARHHKDGPHVMRHSCATWMVGAGTVPLPEIASYLGMSIEVLTTVYWHHSPHYQGKAATASDRP
jgi:integrase